MLTFKSLPEGKEGIPPPQSPTARNASCATVHWQRRTLRQTLSGHSSGAATSPISGPVTRKIWRSWHQEGAGLAGTRSAAVGATSRSNPAGPVCERCSPTRPTGAIGAPGRRCPAGRSGEAGGSRTRPASPPARRRPPGSPCRRPELVDERAEAEEVDEPLDLTRVAGGEDRQRRSDRLVRGRIAVELGEDLLGGGECARQQRLSHSDDLALRLDGGFPQRTGSRCPITYRLAQPRAARGREGGFGF